jgi:hypothetical protein
MHGAIGLCRATRACSVTYANRERNGCKDSVVGLPQVLEIFVCPDLSAIKKSWFYQRSKNHGSKGERMARFIVKLILDVEAATGDEAVRMAKRYCSEHDDYDVEVERMESELEQSDDGVL